MKLTDHLDYMYCKSLDGSSTLGMGIQGYIEGVQIMSIVIRSTSNTVVAKKRGPAKKGSRNTYVPLCLPMIIRGSHSGHTATSHTIRMQLPVRTSIIYRALIEICDN
jgi:hypothetical protein